MSSSGAPGFNEQLAPSQREGDHARLISVLLLEDSPLDAELVIEQLAMSDLKCAVNRVDNREDFVRALEEGAVDVILSDFSLPSYDGFSALAAAQKLAPEVPFLFVSGAIGEELAIDSLRRGATDYVLKHRLDRLAPAVRRALQEADERAARRRAEAERDQLLIREREARYEAESANRMKDEFLAVVSHELRTPLNAMLGWLQLMRAGVLPEERREHALETVERNAKIQAQLVEDLLDLSRIITGKLRLEIRPVDLTAVIEAAVDAVRPAAKLKGIGLDLHLEAGAAPVLGDPYRLQQVVWNLVSNAIKFTPPRGSVEVRLTGDDKGAEITVTDTGEGIDADFLPYVFERFRQAEGSMNRRHGGLGLGLAIVRHMTELHGGTAHAESPGSGKGSTFRVRLPIQPAPEGSERVEDMARSQRGPDTSLRLDGVRALLVEDEPDARELLITALEQYGVSVTACGSAAEALSAIDRAAPDVLISDIGMPVIDGYMLIRRVRSLGDARGGHVPAIALTAYARGEDSRTALDAGFQMHIPKPVDPEYLAAVIAKLTAPRLAES